MSIEAPFTRDCVGRLLVLGLIGASIVRGSLRCGLKGLWRGGLIVWCSMFRKECYGLERV